MEDVRAYQLHLIDKKYSWSHINQVACALRFFYGITLGQKEALERIVAGKEPEKLPPVLNREEITRFLDAVPSLRNRVALTTAYAAGMRVGEVVRLKISSIDSERMLLHIEGGKGGRGWGVVQEAAMPLVPRRTFFRNPDRANVDISPDGTLLAWTEPVAGVQNIFVAAVDDLAQAHIRLLECHVGGCGWIASPWSGLRGRFPCGAPAALLRVYWCSALQPQGSCLHRKKLLIHHLLRLSQIELLHLHHSRRWPRGG